MRERKKSPINTAELAVFFISILLLLSLILSGYFLRRLIIGNPAQPASPPTFQQPQSSFLIKPQPSFTVRKDSLTVVITASDPMDHYGRFYYVFLDKPPGRYEPPGGCYGCYENTDSLIHGIWPGRVEFYIPLSKLKIGPHILYFAITASPLYGTYSGSVKIGSQDFPFSNVDVRHPDAVHFMVSGNR
jgi:hypothetical protein